MTDTSPPHCSPPLPVPNIRGETSKLETFPQAKHREDAPFAQKDFAPETDAAQTLESAMLLRFPPFPAVPDGVELVPFHLFQPSGIRVPIDGDDDDDDYDDRRAREDVIERDGLGIPTIPLHVKHAADNMEEKEGGGIAAQQVQDAPEGPKTWWELWEELEDTRRNAYDALVPVSHTHIACCFP